MSVSTRLSTALLGTLALLPGLGRSQERPTFSVSTNRVRVDVVVTRGGRPVTGLTKNHFDLREDGARQAPEVTTGADLPAQVILVLDTSASMAGEKLDQLKTAAHALIKALTERDCIALVTFSYNARLRTTTCAGREEAAAAIDALTAGGTTALYDALYASLLMADPGQGRAVLLALSDGEDKASWFVPGEVLHLARSLDATVYSVSLTSEGLPGGVVVRGTGNLASGRRAAIDLRAPGVQLLADLTRDTGGRVFKAEGGEGLKEAFLGLMEEIRSRYVLHYEAPGTPKPGWHRIEVRLRDVPGATTRARAGYFAVQ